MSWARAPYGGAQAPSNYHREDATRAELFAGAGGAAGGAGVQNYPHQQQPTAAGGRDWALPKEDLQYMDSRQVMDHAVEQHRDTTATARRALQVVEQTKELQASTIGALQDQGQQMQRVAHGMDRIGTDLTYSQRILRYMSMCCCVGFFCSSCTEPERDAGDRNWRPAGAGGAAPPQQKRGGGGKPPPPKAPRRPNKQQQEQQQAGGAAGGASAYPGVNTDGLDAAGFGAQAAAIRGETQQQDAYLDQISAGLDQIKQGALVMQDELGRQQGHVARLQQDAHLLHGRLNAVNREGFRNV